MTESEPAAEGAPRPRSKERQPDYVWGETPGGPPALLWERQAIPLWAQCVPAAGCVLLVHNERISAAAVRDGTPLWERELPAPPADYAWDGDGILLDVGRQVLELELRDGRTRWADRSGGVSALALGPRLACVAGAGRVAAYSRRDGRRRWQVRITDQVSLDLHEGAGVVVTASQEEENFRVLSLENGRLLWEHIAEESPVVPGPIVGKLLIASAHDAGLIGFSLAEGVELWRRETDRSFEQPALALEDAILGVDGTLVCLDAATGTRRWEQRLTDPDDAFYRAFAAGKLLLADTWSGRLLALDPASGCIRWERRCGALLGLSVGIGRVYTWAEPPTQGEEGRLLALALDTGEPAWEMRSRRLLQDVTAAGDAVVVEWKNRVLALAGGP